jgi:hypothetical protein
VATLALLLGALLAVTWGHRATPAVSWMNQVDLQAFRTAADVREYMAGLRTGIPPLLAVLELSWWVRFRDLSAFTDVLYPICVALAFALAVRAVPGWQATSPGRALAVGTTAVFLAGQGIRVHAGNPALYDAVFGVLLVAYLAASGAWTRTGRPRWMAAAGTALALMELTRPFVLYLLPVLLLVETHRIRGAARGRGRALAFLVLPVALLSGGWHLHLYRAHDGQVAWTNISGFNLQRAWEDFDPAIGDAPRVEPLPGTVDRWADLNTDEFHRRSEALKSLIASKILNDPAGAAAHAFGRVLAFGSAPTKIYHHDPQGVGVAIYRAAVVALNLVVLIHVSARGAALLLRGRCPWLDPRWWPGAAVAAIAIVAALGEKGEEARFVFSILPALLAAACLALDEVPRVAALRARRAEATS